MALSTSSSALPVASAVLLIRLSLQRPNCIKLSTPREERPHQLAVLLAHFFEETTLHWSNLKR